MSDNAVEEILGQIPMDQLAAQLGTDQASARQAAEAVIPSLIGGMRYNATDPSGERNLAGAMLQHEGSSLFGDGEVNLNDIDTADGQKIVHHVFGDQTGQLAQALGTRQGANSGLIEKLLPILAPIVIAYLAKKINAGMSNQMEGKGGILNDILGGALGGGSQSRTQQQPTQTTQQSSGGGILSDILGGLLGGAFGGGAASQAQTTQQQNPFDRPSQTQTRTTDGPFNTPSQTGNPNDPGNLVIEDDPTLDQGTQTQTGQQQQSRNPLDEILGGLFGR